MRHLNNFRVAHFFYENATLQNHKTDDHLIILVGITDYIFLITEYIIKEISCM